MAEWVAELGGGEPGGGGGDKSIGSKGRDLRTSSSQKTIEPPSTRETNKREGKKKAKTGFRKKKTTDFCSICSSIPASSSSLYETLKPESSVAAALLLFQSCRLVHPVESCMKDTKEKKNYY